MFKNRSEEKRDATEEFLNDPIKHKNFLLTIANLTSPPKLPRGKYNNGIGINYDNASTKSNICSSNCNMVINSTSTGTTTPF